MHSLLKRQLKKLGYIDGVMTQEQLLSFIKMVDQAYIDNDDDRKLLENTLELSSKEMRGLYEKLESKTSHMLAQSERRYQNIISNLHEYYLFYTHGTDGVFTFLSDSVTEILGYSKDEFLKHYSEYMTDDPINKKVIEYTELAIAGKQQEPYIVSVYHKNSSIKYLEVTEIPIFDEDGKVLYIEGIAKDITKEYVLQQEVSHIAKHDTLTGISNRLHLEELMKKLISASRRYKQEFAFLFLDLDHFKKVNDTYGHDVGDQLLQEITNTIKSHIREEDIFARIGGDEFIIVFSNSKEETLKVSLDKIMNLMRQTWNIREHKLNISASIGVALYPKDATTTKEIMKYADIAMYKAKKLGRNNYSFF
jgi:diguanylate cyclase (GGDEF)-like protein/PAS domain S-box-containing protein